ncbi:hypothetical protein [Haloglomus halophilum]|uniref:hypothetical protein n=1 Tax=Haloglomus halophilum TaxID=2962672 RepID=UPI0020C9519A|nr:hypothetical protein [Haloglomus halophilum]
MRRRALLAGLAGLAGCSGLSSDESGTTLTPAPVPTGTLRSTPDPFNREFDLADAAFGFDALTGRTLALHPPGYGQAGLAVRLRFVRESTAEEPARLRAALRPRATAPTAVAFDFPPFVPRARLTRQAGPAMESTAAARACYLVPAPGSSFAEHVPDVELAGGSGGRFWRLAGPPRDWLPDQGQVPVDGTLVGEFRLVAGPAATAPLAGRYVGDAAPLGGISLSAWDRETPGPTADSRFDVTVPQLPQGRATLWYHELSPRASVSLRPTVERVEPPATVTLTLVNHSREAVRANDWSVHRLVDGDWYELGPLFTNGATRFVPPGGRHRWRFGLAHGPAADVPGELGPLDHRLGFLGGGRYGIAAGSTDDEDRPAALVELVAPELTVRPTADATVTRDGERVVVEADPPRDDADDEPRTLVLDRLPLGDRTATPRPTVTAVDGGLPRLLPEQAMRSRGLRNTLPFVEGTDQVRLRTNDDVTRRALRRVAFRTGGRRFRFGDGDFRVTVGSTQRPDR